MFRIIPKFEDNARITGFSQTVLGKLVLLAIFGLTLSAMGGVDKSRLLILAFLSAITFLPKIRRFLVLACTVLVTNFFWFEHGILDRVAKAEAIEPTHRELLIWIILPFMLTCAVLMWIAAKRPQGWFARRPLLWLLGLYAALVGIACYAPLHGFLRFALWSYLLIFVSYFWYLAYAVRDRATPGGDNLVAQFATFHPFWGGTTVPFPKGASYWRRIEAKTPAELGTTMIKGVKLIVWCFLLSTLNHYYLDLAYRKFGVPSLGACLQAFSAGRPFHPMMNWVSLVTAGLADLLTISIWGHMTIATCRMAGFRALRNTYAPLSSRTVAEYWNRYYFYFKELLVDMFFYPTFIHCFTHYRKLRIFFATFVAVWLGSTLFHFMRDTHHISISGLPNAIIHYPYAVYSIVLALAISISQVRQRPSHGSRRWWRERLTAPVCVFGFFCILSVFETAGASVGLCLHFLVYLFSGR